MRDEDIERIGELLIEEGIVCLEDVHAGIQELGDPESELARTLLSTNSVLKEELAAFLSMDFRVPEVDLNSISPTNEAIKLVPENVARKHQMIPVARVGGILCVAKPNFYNRAAVRELRNLTHLKIKVLKASEEQVDAAINKYYSGVVRSGGGTPDSAIKSLEDLSATPVQIEPEIFAPTIEEAPVLEAIPFDDGIPTVEAIPLEESGIHDIDALPEIEAVPFDELPRDAVAPAAVSDQEVADARAAAFQDQIEAWERDFVSGQNLEAVSLN